jgi:integrase
VRQKEDRLKAGHTWQESGLVFTSTIGTPADGRNVRLEFKAILEAAKLGHLKIHGLRHTCASLLLSKAVHPKIVQETLGHSQIGLALDTYSHLIPGLQQEAAHTIDALLTEESEQSRKEEAVGVKVGVNQPGDHPEVVAIRQVT